MKNSPSSSLLTFFENRVRNTYALEERFKQDLLHQMHTFDTEQIENILRVVYEYEQKIAKDARKEVEEKSSVEEKKKLQVPFHFF